jgi:thiol-disulfide isomerase/thioredoxin
VHFWATWCPPCREELPALLALSRDLARGGRFELVAVSVDRDWKVVESFFGGSVPPEVVRDAKLSGARAYGVSFLPDSYLVDADGNVVLRILGARDWKSRAAKTSLAGHASG